MLDAQTKCYLQLIDTLISPPVDAHTPLGVAAKPRLRLMMSALLAPTLAFSALYRLQIRCVSVS